MNHSVISVYATVPREILNLTGHVIWCEHCGGTIAVGEIHKCREQPFEVQEDGDVTF